MTWITGHVQARRLSFVVLAAVIVCAAAFGRWPGVASVAGGVAAGLFVLTAALDLADRVDSTDKERP